MVLPMYTQQVFSAYAEVVPIERFQTLLHYGILRVRGGSSPQVDTVEVTGLYSPRTRR